MEDERLSTVGSKFHLPMDLWPGILSRLPVKCLLRFRCVSKSWLALISDPDFVRLHLKNFKNNHQETHLLLVEGNQQDCHVLCLDTFKTEAATLAKHGKYVVLFAVDGLVLLGSWFTDLPGLGHVIVSNPSIRKCHEILPEPEDSGCFSVGIGLGYDPLVKDYKLVKLVFDSVVRVAIYTLGAGSWKSIQFQGKGCCSWHWEPYCIATKKVYLRGSLYFIARDLDTSVWELVSFDLSEEVFSSTSLPDCTFFRSVHFEGWLSLADGGSSLGVISFEPSSSFLWVLESSGDGSESVCWTKRYSFSVAVTKFLHITKKGGALIRQCVQETSADAKDGFNRVISYNLETEEEKILLQIESDQVLNIYGLYDYVESLILLD